MATKQVLLDNYRYYIIKVFLDAAEAGTNIVDVSALTPPCTRVKLWEAQYDIDTGSTVELLWDATADVSLMTMSPGPGQTVCFENIGGLTNNAGAGITGDVLVTKVGTTDATLILTFVKKGITTVN